MDEHKQEYIQGLRDLADWLEHTPDAPVASSEWLMTRLKDKDHAVRVAKQAVGGIKKNYFGSSFELTKSFGPVHYVASISREEVCTAKVVGKKTVEKVVIPDEVREQYKVVEFEDEVEWECDPLLASD